MHQTLDNTHLKAACEKCSLQGLCLPVGLSENDIAHLDKIIQKRQVFHKGDKLFSQNQGFAQLYAVRTGTFKSVNTTEFGREQVNSFHLPGELIGFDAIHPETYPATCIALETSSVCTIPYHELLKLAAHLPSLNQHLLKILSENIHAANLYNIHDSAIVRLSKFILNLSSRFKRIGRVANEFALPMTRHDIADYLGLAEETLSRLFKKLQQKELITLKKRDLIIHDLRKLQVVSCGG